MVMESAVRAQDREATSGRSRVMGRSGFV